MGERFFEPRWIALSGVGLPSVFHVRSRQASLQLLMEPTSRFAEYLEPYTGEPLGSMDQSWTAAAALDWLALEAKTHPSQAV